MKTKDVIYQSSLTVLAIVIAITWMITIAIGSLYEGARDFVRFKL